MLKADVTVDRYMTQQPQWLFESSSVAQAKAMLEKYKIRHLPVKSKDGQLIGLLSEREVNLAYGIESIDLDMLLVTDICRDRPYIVDIKTPLKAVAKEMAKKHLGSAVVVEDGALAGIFTTVDACRALAQCLGEDDF